MKKKLGGMLLSILVLFSLLACSSSNNMFAEAATKQDISVIEKVAPSGFGAYSIRYNRIKTKWDAIAGVDGYIVYRADSEDGKYTKVYTTSNPEKTWYINTGRTTGKTYWYKMRGFAEVDGKCL